MSARFPKKSLAHLSTIPTEEDIPGRPPGVKRQELSLDPTTGYVTWLLEFPPRYQSLWGEGRENELEYHASSEEILTLEGSVAFGHWYELPAMTYSFHPAGWVHPAAQHSADGCRVLMRRSSADIDFEFVEPPRDWNGEEYNNLGESGSTGITRLALADLPWLPLLTPTGVDTGISAKVLLEDDGAGWCTWMMSVPAGWRGRGSKISVSGGDEMLLLAGDLRMNDLELQEGSFYRDTAEFNYGAALETSREGCLAMRWSLGHPVASHKRYTRPGRGYLSWSR